MDYSKWLAKGISEIGTTPYLCLQKVLYTAVLILCISLREFRFKMWAGNLYPRGKSKTIQFKAGHNPSKGCSGHLA